MLLSVYVEAHLADETLQFVRLLITHGIVEAAQADAVKVKKK